MSEANVRYVRNEHGYPVIESSDWEASYRRLVSADGMMAHKVTGAIMGLMFALGFIGWLWTFVF